MSIAEFITKHFNQRSNGKFNFEVLLYNIGKYSYSLPGKFSFSDTLEALQPMVLPSKRREKQKRLSLLQENVTLHV